AERRDEVLVLLVGRIAVIPPEFARRQAFAFGKLEANARGKRESFGINARSDFEFDDAWKAEFERAEGHVHSVTGHVTEGACAEVIPTAPGEGVINAAFEGPKGSRAEPQIPVHIFWNLVF